MLPRAITDRAQERFGRFRPRFKNKADAALQLASRGDASEGLGQTRRGEGLERRLTVHCRGRFLTLW